MGSLERLIDVISIMLAIRFYYAWKRKESFNECVSILLIEIIVFVAAWLLSELFVGPLL